MLCVGWDYEIASNGMEQMGLVFFDETNEFKVCNAGLTYLTPQVYAQLANCETVNFSVDTKLRKIHKDRGRLTTKSLNDNDYILVARRMRNNQTESFWYVIVGKLRQGNFDIAFQPYNALVQRADYLANASVKNNRIVTKSTLYREIKPKKHLSIATNKSRTSAYTYLDILKGNAPQLEKGFKDKKVLIDVAQNVAYHINTKYKRVNPGVSSPEQNKALSEVANYVKWCLSGGDKALLHSLTWINNHVNFVDPNKDGIFITLLMTQDMSDAVPEFDNFFIRNSETIAKLTQR